jgi:hypothetical protein
MSVDILDRITGSAASITVDERTSGTANTPHKTEDIPIIVEGIEITQALDFYAEVLPGYDDEAKKSILRGLTQEGSISRGSFSDSI